MFVKVFKNTNTILQKSNNSSPPIKNIFLFTNLYTAILRSPISGHVLCWPLCGLDLCDFANNGRDTDHL